MVGIYKITSPSGKIYIGQSWNIEKRLSDYKSLSVSKKQKMLNRSFCKYGYNSHKFEIIKHFEGSFLQSDLDRAEIFYIYKYRSLCFKMLNLTIGGKGGKGTIKKKRLSWELLYDLYITKNHTKIEISKIVNQKERLIKKYLSEYKILKPHNLKIIRDTEVKEQSMKRVYYDEILKLREQGMSYKEIIRLIPVTNGVISSVISNHKNKRYDFFERGAQ